MKYVELPDTELLREMFFYNPEEGKLYWKKSPQYNTKLEGKEAGYKTKKARQVEIQGKAYYVHRVIWAIVTGSIEADMQIDHIDGDYNNNKFSNLREVTQSINKRNQSLPKNNTSGTIGVSKHKSGLWISSIPSDINGSRHKYFKTKDEAIQHRKEIENTNGFHANHGRNKNNNIVTGDMKNVK